MLYDLDRGCDGPGPNDFCFTYHYDDAGLRVAVFQDNNCTGAMSPPPEDLCVTTYEHDDRGRIIASQADIECDGSPFRCWTYGFDDRDQQISFAFDDGCNGRGVPVAPPGRPAITPRGARLVHGHALPAHLTGAERFAELVVDVRIPRRQRPQVQEEESTVHCGRLDPWCHRGKRNVIVLTPSSLPRPRGRVARGAQR